MKYVLIVFAVIVIAILVFLINNGIFVKPKIVSKVVGPYRLVYDKHIGEYRGTKAVMDKVYEDLLAIDISTTKGFGFYFDNPKTTPTEELRSYAGCVVDPSDFDKLTKDKSPAITMDFPKQECYVTEFPFKGPVSVIMGIMKVYPQMNSIRAEGADLPMMEIYDVPNKKIIYIAIKNELDLQPVFIEDGETPED